MIRQTLNIFAVTVAFAIGAIVSAVVLDIQSVQTFLGVATSATETSYQAIPLYIGTATLAGLIVDGLRLVARKWWHRNRQLEHDLEDLFRSNLA